MIELARIKEWARMQDQNFATQGIKTVGVSETEDYKPSICIDYDGFGAIGRIIAWTSGEFDFEVLDAESGVFRYLNHQLVETLDAADLAKALREFGRALGEEWSAQ